MAWYWHASILKDVQETDFKRFLTEELGRATEGNFTCGLPKDGCYETAAGVYQLACISSEPNGWLGFLGLGSRLCLQMIERGKYSGLVFDGSDDELAEGVYAGNWWFYMLLEEGNLVDWHVHNPAYLFGEYSEEVHKRYTFHYLQDRGIYFDTLKRSRLIDFMKNNPDYLWGDVDKLRAFTGTQSSPEVVQEWLGMRAVHALKNASDVLGFPFVNRAVDALPIAVYRDVKRGTVPLEPSAYPFNDPRIYNLYQWAVEQIPQVENMTLVPFRWSDGVNRSRQFLDRYTELFYWE